MNNPELPPLLDIVDPFEDELLAPPPPPPPLESSPTRTQVQRSRWMALALALVSQGVMLAAMGPRADLSEVTLVLLLAAILLPALAALAALQIATHTGPLGLGQSPRKLSLLLLAPTLLFSVSALVPAGSHSPISFWKSTAECILGTMMFALMPLGLALFAFRRSFLSAAPLRTAAIGLACGALAAAAIELRCSIAGWQHVLLGHGVALLVCGGLGYGLARFTRILPGSPSMTRSPWWHFFVQNLVPPAKVSLVVGTILCLINRTYSTGSPLQIGLNYLVPFLVSSYSRFALLRESRSKNPGIETPRNG